MIANAASSKRGAERHVVGSQLPTRMRHDGVRSIPGSKEFPAETPYTKCIRCIRCSDNQNESQPSWPDEDGPLAKADKKLHNVLPPKIPSPRKPVSYLELHRRRFSVPPLRRRIRSPVGSTLSICGDSQQERLTDESGDVSLPSSRDDQSELSFYRRLIERGQCSGLWDRLGKGTASGSSFDVLRQGCGSFAEADSRSRRKVTYRPYTIQDYRSLSVPQRDRSLGPDKAEIQVKREWLMRRRSYGDSVSARNRQQILQRARELKSRRVGAQKYPQPPLKDRDGDSKGHGNSDAFHAGHSAGDSVGDCRRKDRGKLAAGVRVTERTAASGSTRSGEKSRTLEKSGCFCEPLNSRVEFDDSRLRQLRLRHHRQRLAENWLAGKVSDEAFERSKREEMRLVLCKET